MLSRSLPNLFLLLLLVGMIGFYTYQQSQPVKQEKLTSLTPEQIHEIRIPRKHQDIVLHKQKSGWWMQSPYSIQAHDFRIKTLINLSQAPVDKAYPVGDLQLEDYALQPPRARILFNDIEVAFGKTNPVNQMRYLMSEGQLSLHADKTYPLVSAQATAFIDLKILPASWTIQSIDFDSTPDDSTSAWQLIPFDRLAADQRQQLLDAWQHAQAFAIHAYMQRPVTCRVILQAGQQAIEFEINETDSWLILGRRDLGIEYHLDGALKNRLFAIRNDA